MPGFQTKRQRATPKTVLNNKNSVIIIQQNWNIMDPSNRREAEQSYIIIKNNPIGRVALGY